LALGGSASGYTIGGSTILRCDKHTDVTIDHLVLGDGSSSHASLVTAGTVILNNGAIVNGAENENVKFTSAGAVTVESGIGSIGVDFTSKGRIAVLHDADLKLSGVANSIAGTVAGSGTLEFVSGTQVFQAN